LFQPARTAEGSATINERPAKWRSARIEEEKMRGSKSSEKGTFDGGGREEARILKKSWTREKRGKVLGQTTPAQCRGEKAQKR